jgi:3-oxoadipate enol-lactonase
MAERQRVAPDRTGFVPVESGTRCIYWEYFGDRSDGREREVVVLLNGLAMLTRSWYRNVPSVYPEYDVLLYDYLGQGQSSQEDEPYFIPKFCDYLVRILDELGIERIHPVGVSYGGFIAADLGRLYGDRLHTLTLSGIILTRETLFQMYQDLSLMFYRLPEPAFEIYTHYMYEKIFGEKFAQMVYGVNSERTRLKFYDRYQTKKHCLIRLTEAQDPFFENIDRNPDAYRGVTTPTLIFTGEQDRALPPWQQRKLLDILPNARQIMVPESGHLTYLERPDIFWPMARRFFRKKAVDFEAELDPRSSES